MTYADRGMETVFVSIGQAPDQVLLGLTEAGAQRLVEDISRELKVLAPADHCEECDDTGERWVPMGVGAIRLSSCHCRAAAAKR
ncbi:hypothetical protein ACQPZF_37595 [Actinosynnema sp. CS-041913]|uniref:hypothetical protein n=1 Tax=Actinosynnema sp. CS-041913 TaxID=3239917 RepID=UPI003D910F51